MSPSEFSGRVGRLPKYPAAPGYAWKGDIARMASNESPDPPLPEVLEAAQRALQDLNRYPDPSQGALRESLSDRYGVPVERIAIGNGGSDLLLAAGDALLDPGAEIVYPWPSFSLYPHMGTAAGATEVRVPLKDDYVDLDGLITEITAATRLVVVCNPNNPTSTALPLEEIEAFLERVPRHVWVLIDEAYCEYSLLGDPDDTIPLLRRFPNAALLRTFSKVYGLCGLRVGFVLCGSVDLCQALYSVRQPFSANAVAQAAAVEAIRHQDAVAQRVERAVAARLQLDAGLRRLGIEPLESHANFSWFRVGEPEQELAIVNALAERGVLVRSGTALGEPGFLRVTYGLPHENDRFLAELGTLL
ncbi:histidinol-phosphate transaminase [Capillimicrobium parvum]|uniref:Histidinol-phosphate aminotransferase n=1 Tax=Capillimicrobium parvum TaxID=2884022 RepID=A0A9E6XWQ6_9ACTN|nr:histidinol-phosphate transaminase [Capillimicrobium parvum]UGS35794.1 Putative phenylalanine aminotransferase [Capillimicrobium parvum]